MEYRVLGTLDVRRNGVSIDLGPFRQRALLALLLTAPNTVFSTDQIIEQLWGDDGTADRQNSVWVYVSGLRKVLEPERESRSDGTILLTRSPGYVLHCAPDDVDAVRFEGMVAEGRALAEADAAAASVVFGEALALWRGRAFEEFTYEDFAQPEIARLEALRLETVEARIDADLDRGFSRELISELETLTREHPLQERITGQLMLALYRSGRQADALRVYQQLRSRLGAELGVEPSAGIRGLEAQIVTGDPALESGASSSLPGSGPRSGLAVRGYELREKLGERSYGTVYRAYQPAVGREVAMKIIPAELANDPDFIRRFETEAQVVARLEHPHIVPLYDYWREPDAAYLVMRLLKGGTLAALLQERALAYDEASRMLEQVGSALDTAHRAGVVHRDVRPENILIDDEGNAYLSDFGIALGADSRALVGSGPATLIPAFTSPELRQGGDPSVAADLYSLGVVMAQALTGLNGEIEQVRGALTPSALAVIDRATATDATERPGSVAEFVVELRTLLVGDADVIDVDSDLEVENPYKGLRAFDAVDAADFHGRERLIERLVARLGEPGTRGRFVAVVGPSGSGKSSVVRAGLLPALRTGALPMSERWFTVSMAPAPHPFEALEDALLGVAIDPPASLLEQIAGDNGLQRALNRVLPNDGSQLLLVIDQFEEIFTQVDAKTSESFLDMLAAAVRDAHSRVRVVVTLRADFYDRPLRHRGLGELVRDGTEAITPLTAEELERAITAPAGATGVTFEPAVVAELVHDVIDRSGALPLLQYTLTELFDARSGSRITDVAYRELGGVSGALVERADGLLARLGENAHDVTRQVFLRLVTLGEGADDTRRRVLRSELEQLSGEKETVAGVLDTFGRHRLLSFDRDPVTRSPTVEISHEALLTEWTRLRGWIDGARHDVRNQRRLAEAMAEWSGEDRDDAYLLRGGRLEQLNGWSKGTTLPLSEPEQTFLDASVAERDRAENEEREREQRTIDAELREKHRSRQLAIAGTAGVLVALLAAFGIWQWRSAEDRRADAEAARAEVDNLLAVADLVGASEDSLDENPELALLLAVQAVKQTVALGFATDQAVDSVHWALQEHGVQIPVDSTSPVAVRSGPNGLTGVFALAPAELVAIAEQSLDRELTDAECQAAVRAPCATPTEVPTELPIRGGMEAYGAGSPGQLALAGTTVTLAATGAYANDDGFRAQLAAFEEVTGVAVEHVARDLEDVERVANGEIPLPDIMGWAGGVADWMKPRVLDLGAFLDEEALRADYDDYLLRVGAIGPGDQLTADSTIRSLPFDLDLKGMVYYPKQAFEAEGYVVPSSWAELVELSDQMVADGHAPWCFGFGSGFASGWPGTDFLESVVIRVGGVDAYDSWTAGELGFSDEVIIDAARLAESVIFAPGYVHNGPESISTFDFSAPMFGLLQRDRTTGESTPDCWMYHQADFMLSVRPPGDEIGVDLDFFMLPPIGGGVPPVTGSINAAAGLVDRPEVRAFLAYMATPEWGQVWAQDRETINFIAPNKRFELAAYGPPDEPMAQVRTAMVNQTHDALEAGLWRRDASDLMPPPIGAGSFWEGMLDWVDGLRPIEEIFAEIDAQWGALDSESSG